MDDVTERHRGASTSHMRAFVCKECQREVERLEREVATLEGASGRNRKRLATVRAELQRRRDKATYNENWARNVIERGGSRSDRCREHRQRHRTYIQGIAVAYIDLETVGEIADRTNPTGPLGGLGPLPTVHEIVENTSYDLQKVNVGMTDEHIVEMIRLLRERRVLILKAGTGTGKSTFAPYRLMDPPSESLAGLPADAPFGRLTELGPIIVTEPRVQAAVGVATFVGAVMSGAGGVGPGYPVGYQVSGDRAHDEACELIYVTDGTMINWLREGRLSRIGTLIVDEAHERSTNIDFIMGFLRRELDRYPHLRVIITSATFNVEFYQEFFGGPEVAHVMEVPAEKPFGYGMPLFPALDTPEPGEDDALERWRDESLPLSGQHPRDEKEFLRRHWPTRHAPPLDEDDVLDPDDIGYREDVWHTTAQLLDLRYTGQVPAERWRERMPAEMTEFIVRLAKGLDERGIYGDVLGFLPTRRTIELVCAEIERQLGRAYEGHVFPLISTLGKEQQRAALAKRRKGDPRKIVISTNLAETSLTVEGVRFVVDSGVIAQSEWDPELAKGDIPTKPHSQAGIKQRWGRVGRKAPGWVFPLYTKGQYLDLAEDTPPGSTRENLEALVMTARMGGIDDVLTFPWPAAFEPTTTELDDTARQAMRTFQRELVRADAALRAGGAVDSDGHPTSFGRELIRFQGLGSTGSALAILYADRLTCVPEVATVLALLEDTRLVGRRGLLQDDPEWPDEWRLEAADRHRGLASLCADDAELVLLIAAAWDAADPASAPWEPSGARERWARQWWLNHDLLLETAQKRQQILAALSPAMKDEVKRFLELSVIDRVRGVLTRSLAGHRFRRTDDGLFGRADPQAGEDTAFALEDDTLVVPAATEVIALRRREARTDSRISNLVIAQPWALAEPGSAQPTGTADAIRMVVAASRHAPTRPDLGRHLAILASWPVGQRIRLRTSTGGKEAPETAIDEVLATIEPFPQPVGETTPGRRRLSRRADPDDAEATRADSDGELRPQTGRIGYADEHTLRENAFRRNDLEVDAYAACGACPRCLAGRTEACEQLSRREPTAAAREDPVREWQAAARCGIDVSTPPVLVPGRTLDEQRWYEVTSYRPGNGEVTVELRPDWRNGAQGNPAQHQGVQAGDPIEVRVGPALRHHGGALRSFERVDGRGRFVLAEASTHRADLQEKRREIAVSLHHGAYGLLDSLQPGATLVATVMPARARDCYTITLLELLHQHLSKASPGSGIEYQAPNPTRRVAARTKLYNAIVSQPPNDAGYAQAVLLHRDSARGIRHLVTLPAQPTANDEAAPAMTIGQPLLLNLVRDKSRLDVSDLDLAELRDIVRHSNRQLDLTGVDDDTEDKEFAPPGAVLLARSDKPLSRSAAIRLAELSDDPQWTSEVWSFWARSHHVALGKAPAYRSGTRTEPVEITADVVIAVESPLEQQRRLTSRYTEQHPAGSVIEASALRVTGHGVYVELVPGLEGLIPIRELSWTFVEDPATVVTPGEIIRALVTAVPEPPDKIELSMRQLTPKPYVRYAAHHPIGELIEANVSRITDSRVFVEVEPGVNGVVHISELSYQRLSGCADVVSEGNTIAAKIIGYDDRRKQVQLSVKRLQPSPYESFRATHPVHTTAYGMVDFATPTHVYVDLGDGVTGIVFVRDLAHERVEDAAALVHSGETMLALIKGYNDQREQVELSRKALIQKPYAAYRNRHSAGDRVDGVVIRVAHPFVFLDLGDQVTGRIHVSELDHTRIDDLAASFPVGTRLTAQIVELKDDRETVVLSRKVLLPPPYEQFKLWYVVGAVVQGSVRNMNNSFVYVDLAGGANGIIHISRLATYRINHPSTVVTLGQRVSARVIAFNDERRQVELSL